MGGRAWRPAPCGSPHLFERIEYARATARIGLKQPLNPLRAAEWRITLMESGGAALVTPEGEFPIDRFDMHERRDAYVYWAGREIAYGDMDYRF